MAEPAGEAAPQADGVSEEAAARPRGFRLLGEDKSVHQALGGGKGKCEIRAFSLSRVVDCSFRAGIVSGLCAVPLCVNQ
jgi:hypothetical protein